MLSKQYGYIPTYVDHIPGINRSGAFVPDVMCVLPHLRLDITGNYKFTNSGSTPIKTGVGPGMNVSASQYIQTVENFSAPLSGSLIVYFNPVRSGLERIVGFDDNFEIGHISSQFFCDLYGSNSTRISSDNGWNILVCSWNSDGSNRRLRNWLNGGAGVDVTETAAAVSPNNLSLGTRTGQTNGLNGDMILFAMSSRELSDAEGRLLSSNPWSIFQPNRIRGSRILPFGVGVSAGGSGNTVDANLEQIEITAHNASVILSSLINANLESLTLTANQADISLSNEIAANLESLSLETFNADVSKGSLVNAQQENINFTAFGAQVSQANLIAVNLETIALQAFQSTVRQSSLVAASVESIWLSALNANVYQTSNIDASFEAIELSAGSATVIVGDQIAASTEIISVNTFSADVVKGSNIQASQEVIELSAGQADVSLEQLINANTEFIELTSFDADIRQSNNINAIVETLSLTTFSADVTLINNEISADIESIVVIANSATIVYTGLGSFLVGSIAIEPMLKGALTVAPILSGKISIN